MNRLPEREASEAVALSRSVGGYAGPSRMLVASPIREVAPATAASTVRESWLG